MNGQMRLYLIEKLAAHPAPLRRVGAIDAVAELCHRERTNDNWHFAGGFAYVSDCLGSGESLSLGRDQDARIEH
jgi:hypothetical protein